MSEPGKPIEIAVADKSPLIRDGLGRLFGGDDRFNLVCVAADGAQFMDMAGEFRFDIGLIGWDMPGLHGREVLDRMRALEWPFRVVVYTGNAAPEVPRQVMEMGAAGFCSKSAPPERLVGTLIAVSEGRMIFPFMDMGRVPLDAGHPPGETFANLTARERELLGALVFGRSNTQIGDDFDISLNTVKYHLKNLYAKLNVKNRTQAVAKYLKSQEEGG